MADRRFPFMDPLVISIDELEKDLTRRINTLREFGPSTTAGYDWHFRDRRGLWNDVSTEILIAKFAPYRPGDTLAVCEALVPAEPTESAPFEWVSYRADGFPALRYKGLAEVDAGGCGPLFVSEYGCAEWGWKVRVLPARYCPTWAIRTRRRILSVRPERLSWVTDDEARREGIARLGWEPTGAGFVAGFRELHGLDADADADPWVWRVEFSKEAPHAHP